MTSLRGGNWLRLSSTYNFRASWSCLRLFMHFTRFADSLARDRAGKSIAARMAIIAMTTSNSINVKPGFVRAAQADGIFSVKPGTPKHLPWADGPQAKSQASFGHE